MAGRWWHPVRQALIAVGYVVIPLLLVVGVAAVLAALAGVVLDSGDQP